PRRRACRIAADDMLFAMADDAPDQRYRLMILADEDISLLEFPTARARETCEALKVDVAGAVDGWVNKLASFLTEGSAPAAAERILDAGPVTVDAGQTARAGSWHR
ncbi:MAG: hypothetical protein ACE5ER_07950, partial [Nitrospinaceae bacterium]